MNQRKKMKEILSMFLPCILLSAVASTQAQQPTNAFLLARVRQGDPDAILEVGKGGDRSFVPILESMARPHITVHIDSEKAKAMTPRQLEEVKRGMKVPVYDEPAARNSRMALAKLGVREYLDEILVETTSPTNSPVYKEREDCPEFLPSKSDALLIQMNAFKKLAYIKDRSTVKVLASFLYAKENPQDYLFGR
jgi:hypothetical protein